MMSRQEVATSTWSCRYRLLHRSTSPGTDQQLVHIVRYVQEQESAYLGLHALQHLWHNLPDNQARELLARDFADDRRQRYAGNLPILFLLACEDVRAQEVQYPFCFVFVDLAHQQAQAAGSSSQLIKYQHHRV